MTLTTQEHHVERLWTAPDGTTCILVKKDQAPKYSVALVRDSIVLRQRRLYGRASAHVVAQGWCDITSR